MLLTKSSAFIIGPIARILGVIMNAIFNLQVLIGIPNIGLAIILFTIVMYLLMTPLTIQQQKFSKLQAKMNPELQAIQKKYKKLKNDQAAQMKMNEETQAVYAKYGVNPMGSCVQLLIQMPILFALYRVIWNIPAYVTNVYNQFAPLATALLETTGAEEYMTEAASSLNVTFNEMTMDTLVDVLYKFKPANWTDILANFPDLSDTITSVQANVDKVNYFLGLNIADSPMTIMTSAFAAGSILLVIGALLVPVLAAATQWLNAKLSMSSNDSSKSYNPDDPTAATMKSMNTVMPLMSAFFCLTLPAGLGVYWIAGAVVRSVQQVLINKKLSSMDLDEMIKKNVEKANEKRKKQGLPPQKIQNTARLNTKSIESTKPEVSEEEKADRMKASTDYYKTTSTAKPGSLAAKAQMVQQFNERGKKK